MTRSITLLGAGLVGSLLAVLLKKRGYEVTVFERRPDMRSNAIAGGRSINLAISERGWRAVEVGGIRSEIEKLAIPMYGRCLHQPTGEVVFQAYGKNNEAIYSISRGDLNKQLMTLAEENGVQFFFEHRCVHVDAETNTLTLETNSGIKRIQADLLLGADGAFSALRQSYSHRDRVDASQHYLAHGYKELAIPPDAKGNLPIEKNALHIWPRKNFMLIALPNTSGVFTCTLFLPFEGEESFEKLDTPERVSDFFEKHFPDARLLMPDLLEDFFQNPISSLITTHIHPWYYQDKSALVGDAAHAIVPFYGQGMNAGFEDCTVLMELLEEFHDDWAEVLPRYDQARKKNGDAVAELALLNFIEMRDKVADTDFLLRKKIEQELGRRYPEQFVSVYEMVSFTHIPYDAALRSIHAQDTLLKEIMAKGDFFECIQQENFQCWLQLQMNHYSKTFEHLQNEHNKQKMAP